MLAEAINTFASRFQPTYLSQAGIFNPGRGGGAGLTSGRNWLAGRDAASEHDSSRPGARWPGAMNRAPTATPTPTVELRPDVSTGQLRW
jgi:hypothetical protein